MKTFFLNESLYLWLSSHGLKILIIAIIAAVLYKLASVFIEKLVARAVATQAFAGKVAEEKRIKTLAGVFTGVVKVLIWIFAGMMILSEIGVNIGPLIAGAGIVGLAFGFGGQYLIRDIISGLFIILENQYRVGDVVKIAGSSGLVEEITLRKTTLRDLDGIVHHIPNGEITDASNYSKKFSRVNLDVGVSYDTDLEKVISVVNRVGKDLAEDSEWKEKIIKAPKFLRVNDFADSSVVIKILGDVKPLKQWEVTGELRKRLKIAFDKEGIEIPFPQRVIHQKK